MEKEFSIASSEQDKGTEQINKSVQQLDMVIQQNASAAEEMSSTSEELSAQAMHLRNTIGFFKIDDANQKKKRASLQKSDAADAAESRNEDEEDPGCAIELDDEDKADFLDKGFEKY